MNKQNLIKKIKNFTINFGTLHPAANGVLRLLLELKKILPILPQNTILNNTCIL